MKGKFIFKLGALCAILSAMLLIPALGQAKEESWEKFHKMRRASAVQELKLSPEKTKEFNTLEDKYEKERQEIIGGLKKSHAEMKQALAASSPDEVKIKGLVAAILAAQDKLVNTFKSQRDAELALMAPVQQGQYLSLLHKWREEMMKEHMQLKNK